MGVHLKDVKAISVGTASNKLVDLVEADLVMIMGRIESSLNSTQSIERETLTGKGIDLVLKHWTMNLHERIRLMMTSSEKEIAHIMMLLLKMHWLIEV